MLLYDYESYNQWGSSMTSGLLGDMSEKEKLRGLDYGAYKMCQCAVLLKAKIIIRNVIGSY